MKNLLIIGNGDILYKDYKNTFESMGYTVDICSVGLKNFDGTQSNLDEYNAVFVDFTSTTDVWDDYWNGNDPSVFLLANSTGTELINSYVKRGGKLIIDHYFLQNMGYYNHPDNKINSAYNGFNETNYPAYKPLAELISSVYQFPVNDLDAWDNSNVAYMDDEEKYQRLKIIKSNSNSKYLENIETKNVFHNVGANYEDISTLLSFRSMKDIIYNENVEVLSTHKITSSSGISFNNGKDFNIVVATFGKGEILSIDISLTGKKYYVKSSESWGLFKVIDDSGKDMVSRIIGNFILNNEEICFVAGSKIQTDQGLFNIEDLIPNQHTINNQKIIAIPKTIPRQLNYLICFEKDALGENIPNEKTIMTHNHKVEYKGELIQALTFLFGDFNNKIYRVEYNNETLYNVLLKEYTKINVNNLIAETLHPDNIISKKYLNNNNDLEKV